MLIQEWLQNNKGNFSGLGEEFGIKATFHPSDDRVILSYSKIFADIHADVKLNPIVRECRGLVLNRKTFEVIARPFYRFFNYGETNEKDDFVWENSIAQDKCDGSLIILYYYNGWKVNTRGSFGMGLIKDSELTWNNLFYLALGDLDIGDLDQDCTYLWELCSLYNKVVQIHPKPKAYLLSVMCNDINWEWAHCDVVDLALENNYLIPSFTRFANIDEVIKHITDKSNNGDRTYEGIVLRDRNNLRLKIKNPDYLALHRQANNGYIASPKSLIPFLIRGEKDELLVYYPELKDSIEEFDSKWISLRDETEGIWAQHKLIESQKDFALAVKSNKLSSILFSARKKNLVPSDLYEEFSELIVEKLV